MQKQLKAVADFFDTNNNFLILTHQSPDGDTLGSATALCRVLQKQGKNASIKCSDNISEKYKFLFEGISEQNFNPEKIVSVDIADTQLLGKHLEKYSSSIDMNIDHHGSNKNFASINYVDSTAAAAAEIIHLLIAEMHAEMDTYIATSIYTGICTDTGCFKYSNVTPRTMRIAADLMEHNIPYSAINSKMFDTKTKARLQMEQKAMESIRYYHNDKCAVLFITKQMVKETGAIESDIEGIPSLPRQIEGVVAGVTFREKSDGSYKISVRSADGFSASKICSAFGGGGHMQAAGCIINAPLENAVDMVVEEIRKVL